ncbi:MAG TPA: tetratricopeptide repeat protein [Burkholderiales bacterium]|nr:tetratricopeptide repeat protein [Burkholderiales bacterium]
MALQKLDLEEQEQLDALRGWWRDNRRLLLFAVVAAAVVFAGISGWRWYQNRQSLEASRLYEALTQAVRAGDVKALRDAGGTLAEQYPRTLYASMGALAAAHFHFERGELKSARAQLEWVVAHAPTDNFRDLARLRLAAVLLDEKSFDEALKLLEPEPQAAYAGQYAAMRGDLLAAKNQRDQARAAYRQALEKTDATSAAASAFRDSVQMRLDALGG